MKTLCLGILSVVAFIFVIGTAGAFDNGSIGFGQCLIQAAIGVGLEWFSLKNIEKGDA